MFSNIATILHALLSAIKNHVSLLYSMPRKHSVTQGITPTEGESVFESYLSVLTHLLGTQEIYESIVNESSDVVSIQEVTGKDSIPTVKKNAFNPIIYRYKSNKADGDDDEAETHYRVYSYEKNESSRRENTFKWKIIDPYDLYQKRNSHGFCQMFAFYIATNNTIGFIDKTQVKETITKEHLKLIHTHNTFECLQKTITLIDKLPVSIINAFKTEFSDLEKDPDYGIPCSMKFSDFVEDLKRFEVTDLDDYIKSLK
tara:strand:- start:1214 stop:1984 length:771 start_codon:yes stop_codon:yes gene_type:complete